MKKEYKSVYSQLFSIILPIAAQNLLSALVSASDAIMLGGLNQSSLSAVSLATQVTFVLNLFYATFTIGATIMAAQYWGKKKKKEVEQVLGIALRYSMLVSVLFWAATFFLPELCMRIFTNENELVLLGAEYLRIVGWSYLCMGITQVYLCIMKNTDRTLRSTIYGTSALVTNLVLNSIFIFGLFGCPALEIQGAALATVCARLLELFLVIWEHRRKDIVKIRWKFFIGNRMTETASGTFGEKKTKDFLHKDFWKYTSPVLLNELAWGCGVTMVSVIMGHLGNDAVAANSVASITKNVIACVCLGLGTGSSIVIGNLLGKEDYEGAKEVGGEISRLTIIVGAISGAIILLASPFIVRISGTLSETAKDYLQDMLLICSCYMIGKSVNGTIIGGIFCAGGDTKFGLLCDVITMWVIIVPLGLLAAFVWKLPVLGVYFLLNLDEFVKLPAVYRHYKKYKWIKNITRN